MNGPDSYVISSNEHFFKIYPNITDSHIITCRLRLHPGEEHLLLDLRERGVTLIPSATSQLASRSKAYQARIFSSFMHPMTRVAYSTPHLLETLSEYSSASVESIVMKRDRKNGGLGVHLFQSPEDLYNLASLSPVDYPVVIQPFIKEFQDIRVVWLNEYREAYQRKSSGNFRHNLHCGGTANAVELSDSAVAFCQAVLDHGRFAYGHMDLMVLPDGTMYLTEINLRGGLRGARIDGNGYRRRVRKIHEDLLQAALTTR